jgi:hypothetical protein
MKAQWFVYLLSLEFVVARASPPLLGVRPALKILDEVHHSYLVNPLEDCCDPGKVHNFQDPGGALEGSSKQSQIVLIDCSLFLIG